MIRLFSLLLLVAGSIFIYSFATASNEGSSTQTDSSYVASSYRYNGLIPPTNVSVVPRVPDIEKTADDWPTARNCMVGEVACTELMDVMPSLCPVAGACDGEGRLLKLAIADPE